MNVLPPLALEHALQRVAALEERLDALESVMGLSEVEPVRVLGFTPTEQTVFNLFRSRLGVVSRHAAFNVLYGLRPECEQVSEKTIDVHITKIRRKLPPGVVLRTIWGVGWYFDAESKLRLDTLIGSQSRAA